MVQSTYLRKTAALISALAVFLLALVSPAPANANVVGDVLGGILGTADGAARGSLGAASTGALGKTISGPSGSFSAIAGGSMSGQDIFARPSALSELAARLNVPSNAAAAVVLELRQRVEGKLLSVSGNTITVATADGTKKLTANADMSAALRAFVGKTIFLRSADGVHVTSIVGQHDSIRGIITAINEDAVTFVTANGEIHTIRLGRGAAAQLGARVGARAVATSNDFDRTAQFAVLRIAASSVLNDIILGNVTRVSAHTVTMRIGQTLQQFAIDATAARLLSSLRGKNIALESSDGTHVKSVVSSPMLDELMAMASGKVRVSSGGVLAQAIAISRNRLTLQLPNGDVMTYLANTSVLHSRTRVAVVLTPLDFVHARILVGTKVLNAVDAGACVTLNAQCRTRPMSGTVVAVEPTTITVRLGNGDLHTLVGNVRELDANAGVPITITPLSGVHAKVVAGAKVANLVDARACVTINSGCRAMPGTVIGVSAGKLLVGLGDGTKVELQGSNGALDIAANVPIIVQPLDNVHTIVQANAAAAGLVNASACVTINAMCVASSGSGGLGGLPSATANASASRNALGNTADANACVTVNAPGCNQSAKSTVAATGCVSINGAPCATPANAGGPGGGGTGPGGPGNGRDIGLPPGGRTIESSPFAGLSPMVIASNDLGGVLSRSAACSNDGQITVSVSDAKSAKALAGAGVKLVGTVNTTWVTGSNGTLRFVRVPTGTYRLVIARSGYKQITTDDFHVDCLQAATISARLARLNGSADKSSAANQVSMTRTAHLNVASLAKTKGTVCVYQLPSKPSAGHALATARSVFCTR